METNVFLLAVFGAADLLSLPELVRAHGRETRKRTRRIERVLPTAAEAEVRAYDAAGAFIGACFRLRLVAPERAGDGEARFRLLDRNLQFEVRRGKAVRVRGLTPAERDQQGRRERSRARRNETLDRKARDAANPAIGRLVDALVRRDRNLAVPRSWHVAGFLPEQVVGRDLVATAAFVAGYHQAVAFDRKRLQAWQACLARAVERGCGPTQDAGPGHPRQAPIETADLEALAGLTCGRQA